jgi:hypothetical protein
MKLFAVVFSCFIMRFLLLLINGDMGVNCEMRLKKNNKKRGFFWEERICAKKVKDDEGIEFPGDVSLG